MGWYSSYDKGSLGNILHFLYYICGLHVAKHAMIDFQKKQINFRGDPFASLSFDDEGFPVFSFIEKEDKKTYDDEWHKVKRDEAIKEWKDAYNQRLLKGKTK